MEVRGNCHGRKYKRGAVRWTLAAVPYPDPPPQTHRPPIVFQSPLEIRASRGMLCCTNTGGHSK